MALPLGKLTLIVGAGLVGSVLAKEGRISNVSDFVSGAFKIVYKQLRQDGSTASTSTSKPKNDSLMQQVTSLRQELQLLASNRSVTIVTGGGSASGKYGVVVIVVVVGYGYVWWKGWKLSDMMFATRRGLNDACGSVAKQLENVYSSISTTRRHLSSSIDRVDCKFDECADNTSATKEEVTELRGDVKLIGTDVQSVHHVVRSLETKISRIEGRQNEMNFGVGKLVHFVRDLENTRRMDQIEGVAASTSSSPALALPQVTPLRAVSLPALPDQPSPSNANNGSSNRIKQAVTSPTTSSHSKGFASGLKDLHGITGEGNGEASLNIPLIQKGTGAPEEAKAESSTASVFGRFSGISASLFTRSRSAMQSFK